MPNPEIVERSTAALPVKLEGSSTNPERSAATKAKVIAATIEALHRYGYAATTTILVAKNANVSRGAMLHHYPNAWDCFKSPAGVARTEIWMATRSDADLADQLVPLYRSEFERSKRGMLRLMKEAGIADEVFTYDFLTFSVATFRGLAMSAALGTPEAEIRAAVDMVKDRLRLKISQL